ncbi:hypothetical protein LGM65_23110 [Burkholderia anthina]|uniref:hypothetical protein n=1 Tax=Burkholderia anthina TaxID=179879 RepID=UPI001CF56423|nr:hypothetical protein [Burkholderia anthina]MCA8093741.1 hypothetical protein [Burkholderia anthina]
MLEVVVVAAAERQLKRRDSGKKLRDGIIEVKGCRAAVQHYILTQDFQRHFDPHFVAVEQKMQPSFLVVRMMCDRRSNIKVGLKKFRIPASTLSKRRRFVKSLAGQPCKLVE